MKNKLTYVILGCTTVVAGIVGFYVFKTTSTLEMENSYTNIKKEENNQQENEKEENSSVEELNNSEIKKLLGYVPYLDASVINENMEYSDAYDGNKNAVDSINKNILLYMAIANAQEQTFTKEELPNIDYYDICNRDDCVLDTYYEESSVNKNLFKMYNTKPIELKELPLPGGTLFYQSPYYLTHYAAGADNYYKITGKIEAKKESELTIIEEALFLKESEEDSQESKIKLNIYANTNDMKKKINALNNIKINRNTEIENINLNNYGEFKYTEFKHTFKKNDKGYYWYQTEVIN